MTITTMTRDAITMTRDAFDSFATDAGFDRRPLGTPAGTWDADGRRSYADRYTRHGVAIDVVTDAPTGIVLYGERTTADDGTDYLPHAGALTMAVLRDWAPVSLVKSYV